MHATIPAFPSGIQNLLFSGFKSGELSGALEGLIDRGAGRLLAVLVFLLPMNWTVSRQKKPRIFLKIIL